MKKYVIAGVIGTMLTAGTAIAMQAEKPATPRAPITKAQMLAAADARFDRLDTNKDGQLSAEERKAGMEAAKQMAEKRRGAMAGRMAERMMGRVDTNGDGLISKAEQRAAIEARFTRMDKNGNGTIDADERGRMGKRMGMHRGGPGVAMMKHADTDKDGAISKAEFDAMSAKRFTRLDANKDGKIDATEMRAGRPHRGKMPHTPAAPAGA